MHKSFNGNIATNTFTGGMNTDMDESLIKADSYKYATNIRVIKQGNDNVGALQLMTGTSSVSTSSGTDLALPLPVYKENTTYITGEHYIIGSTTIRNIGVIVTTSIITTSNGVVKYNYIYKINLDDLLNTGGTEKGYVEVCHGDFGINNYETNSNALQFVTRYESEDNIKVYFTDSKNELYYVNVTNESEILDDYNGNPVTELTKYNTLSSKSVAFVPKPEFVGFITGDLKTGSIQYAVQLYNKNGSQSNLSPLSDMIYINTDNTDSSGSRYYEGSKTNVNSGKGIEIEIPLQSYISVNAYDYIRVYSIFYENTTDLPVVKIINESKLTPSTYLSEERYTYIRVKDTGSLIINELTLEEFNSLSGISLIPKTIEQKDNYLFAANVVDSTWDIDFDARAYRFKYVPSDTGNEMKLKLASSLSDEINRSISLTDFLANNTGTLFDNIPVTHDCINPYNYCDLSQNYTDDYYVYGNLSGSALDFGGVGKNVRYRMIRTKLAASCNITTSTSSDSTEGKLSVSDTTHFNSQYSLSDSIDIPYYGKLSEYDSTIKRISLNNYDMLAYPTLDYSNDIIAQKLRSFQRDEIYRIGCVFYNDKGEKSTVKWIGDIRMPFVHAQTPDDDADYSIIGLNDKIKVGTIGGDDRVVELSIIPLGLEFEFKNVPTGISKIEIVRAKRDIQDRTILTQGLISKVCRYSGSDTTQYKNLRPFPWLAYPTKFGYYASADRNTNISNHVVDNYFILVTPEIVFNQDTFIESIKNYSLTMNIASAATSYYGLDDSTVRVMKQGNNGNGRDLNAGKTVLNNDLVCLRGSDSLVNGSVSSYYEDALIAKYYDYEPTIDITVDSSAGMQYYKNICNIKATINDIVLPTNMNQTEFLGKTDSSELMNYLSTVIGGDTYVNYYDTYFGTGSMDSAKSGPFGVCALFNSDDLHNQIYGIWGSYKSDLSGDDNRRKVSVASTFLVNIKRSGSVYGGETYSARVNTEYISTGWFVGWNVNGGVTVPVFGGDTFINIFEHMTAYQGLWNADTNARAQRMSTISYIPVESSINTNLRVPPTYNETQEKYLQLYAGNYSSNVTYSQNEDMYQYNTAYSANPTAQIFTADRDEDDDNKTFDSRIYVSQPKTNDEENDSWLMFKPLDYIDVDTTYGSINKLKNFRNRLFYFQDKAFGIVSTNERSLIQDNNPGELVLGTGTLLGRFDYISELYGIDIQAVNTMINSDNALYWYNSLNKEIYSYNGNFTILSKVKNINTLLESISHPVSLNALYDKKYNETVFNISDEEKNPVFSEYIQAFSTVTGFNFEWKLDFKDYIFVSNENYTGKLHKYNANTIPEFFDNIYYGSLQYVVNENFSNTKVFDNITLTGNGDCKFNNILCETLTQSSGTIDNPTVSLRESSYNLNVPRSNNKTKFADRLRGKYLKVLFGLKNDGNISIPYINTSYRYSHL